MTAGGNASLAVGNDLTLRGAEVKAGTDVDLTGQTVTLDTAKATNNGSDNVIGTTVQSGGDTTITAKQDVNVIGSSVAAGDKTDADNSHDLNIIGSKIDAKGKVDLSATDNVTIAEARDTGYSQLDTSSKGIFSKKESHSRTETETAVGSSISGGDGVDISSGKDTTISASNIQAGTADNKADLNIDAGGDLIIASGKDTVETDASKSKSGLLSKKSDKSHVYDETTVASELGASGNVNLNAGDNVVIAGSKVTAGDDIAIEGDSVSIIGAQEQHDASSSSKKSGLGAGSGDGFYSVWGKEEKSSKENIVANVGSQLSAGNDVSIKARESDVNIVGSKVEAGNDIALDAARDVNILPGAESYASEEKEKRSGFGVQVKSGNGSASIGIGYGSSKDEINKVLKPMQHRRSVRDVMW
ncbi:hemagluttinin repeat family protein (plasmid) [Ochrobactrum quorumnocens]|uniref:Hemagluttinin repeat family protein n=1 Tax=Ochrobactrum quorumnocens TaxID=271865 RepID=A0A248UNX4_9HYPH|nr:hemagluttinin repeat family protein [[Ochrobactrum] quorumnocens]